MSKTITILCIIPDVLDGTSFYRGIGPLSHLKRKSVLNINLVVASTINWSVILPADIVFMQRPYSGEHVQVAEMAKMQSKPLWIDYDDDLFSVGVDNPSHPMYGNKNIQHNVKTLIGMADVVTASTEHLANKLRTLNPKVTVINNALDLSLFKYRKPNEENKQKNELVMWRGSPTHVKDVLSVANQILQIHDERPDTIFEFVGDRMFLVTEQMKANQFVHTPWKDCLSYQHHIYSRAPKAFIVPLMFSEFNRSKSNISMLEATFAGALTIAPKMHEFEQAGVFTYKDQAEFETKLRDVMNMVEDEHLYYLNLAWNNILEKYTLDAINHKRADLILSIL
jgi:hypothetical protein